MGFMCIVFDAGIDLENCLVQFAEMLKKTEEHRLRAIQMRRVVMSSVCPAPRGSSAFFDSGDFVAQCSNR